MRRKWRDWNAHDASADVTYGDMHPSALEAPEVAVAKEAGFGERPRSTVWGQGPRSTLRGPAGRHCRDRRGQPTGESTPGRSCPAIPARRAEEPLAAHGERRTWPSAGAGPGSYLSCGRALR